MSDLERMRFWLGAAERSAEANNHARTVALSALASAFAAAATAEAAAATAEPAFDLVDRDGDRWEFDPSTFLWSTVITGTRVCEHREDIEEKFGPVREVSQ